MATKRKTTPVAAAAAAQAPAAAPAPALQFVEISLIDTLTQVRKEFDQDELDQLAESIKDMGMLQPVLLRPIEGGRFCVIAGERRVRAAGLAGLAAVPALVGDVSQDAAMHMQLVENIQRADLTLAETAAAVRVLFDHYGEQKKVAAALRKSPSWVSKHLAASLGNMTWQARELITAGITDDLELVQAVHQLTSMHQKYDMRGRELLNRIKRSKAGRKEARELLAIYKQEAQEAKAKAEAAKPAPPKKAAKKQGNLVLEPPKFNPDGELENIETWLSMEEPMTVNQILEKYDTAQKAEIVEYVRELYEMGQQIRYKTTQAMMRAVWHKSEELWQLYMAAAYMLGASDIQLTLENLVNEIRELNS